jgi:DNA polymerase III delta prime subunit
MDATTPPSPKVAPAPGDGSQVELVRGDALPIEAFDWLWSGWLAAGKLHILAGRPGTGKTTLAIALAATVTAGGNWPDGSLAESGSVVIWSGEDDPADTLGPRLLAAGADMSRVYIVRGVRTGSGERRAFDPAKDATALAAELADIADLRFLIVDPIVSAVAGDSHKNAEVRRGLQPLVDLAREHDCALLGISHFTKGTSGSDPLERVTGSLAFGAFARLVLVTATAEEKEGEEARRILARAKSNIGPDGGGYIYDVLQVELPDYPGVIASQIQWGEALDGTARELLADAEQNGDDHHEARDAADWLRETLLTGPKARAEIKRTSKTAGFAFRTVQRAMKSAGVVSERSGFGQSATWRLQPERAPVAPVAPTESLGANGVTGDQTGENCLRCDGEGCRWCREEGDAGLCEELFGCDVTPPGT